MANSSGSKDKSAHPRASGMRRAKSDHSLFHRHVLLPGEKIFYNEALTGSLLLASALVALIWANSPWSETYFALRHLRLGFKAGDSALTLDLQHWINDGLMAIFFFTVALEIKREWLYGELSDIRKAGLPLAAAFGGMLVPAGIYLAFNAQSGSRAGWGIPMATDIAFAIAILALLGNRLPTQLRFFLLTFAIADDIGSILVIAVNYTSHFSLAAFAVSMAVLILVIAMRRMGIHSPLAFFVPALFIWAAMLESGIHATLAGVALGLLTPSQSLREKNVAAKTLREDLTEIEKSGRRRKGDDQALLGHMEETLRQTESLLERMERNLWPWVKYFILPLFALFNAGIVISSDFLKSSLSSQVALGIFFGLWVGKVIGIVGVAWLTLRLGWTRMPTGMQWRHVFGAGMLGGVGFTVALFISELAFQKKEWGEEAKMGVLAASFVSACLGYLYLRLISSPPKKH